MAKSTYSPQALEPVHLGHSHLVCWKSIISGVLISILAYMVLAALGAALIGAAAEGAIENEKGGSVLATGAGLWMGLSIVVSLFIGSFFAVRIARVVTHKLGAVYGIIVSSIFFILMIVCAGSTLGSVAKGFGSLVSGLTEKTASVSMSPFVQDTIYRTLPTSELKSDPKTVVEGLAVRLLKGDVDSAKSYYAYQTGLSTTEVDTKINQAKTEFDATVKEIGVETAEAVQAVGWALFVMFLVGLLGAIFGGRTGARGNVERPLAADPILHNQRGDILPYLFGWILGVPVSILFLIFVLRSIF